MGRRVALLSREQTRWWRLLRPQVWQRPHWFQAMLPCRPWAQALGQVLKQAVGQALMQRQQVRRQQQAQKPLAPGC